MVRWYHLILTGYGFWLPNDPRGSWSDFVGAWELYKFGCATTTDERRSLDRDPHDANLRRAAKASLTYPVVRFDAAQRQAIGAGFGRAIHETQYVLHACCVGHDHAHLVVGRHQRSIEQIGRHLKAKATMALSAAGLHPLAGYRMPDGSVPTPWAKYAWHVFVNDASQLRAAIAYVQRHPEKEGLPRQKWDFVRPWDG